MTDTYSIVIPARFASTRLPGKPLLEIGGKPLIQHVYENACQSNAGAVYIATEDQRVADIAASFGAIAVITSDLHESGTDRIGELISLQQIPDDEIIVNVQGDEYGLPVALIEQVATGLANHAEADMATLCEPLTGMEDYLNPNVVKVVFDKNRAALYFSRSPLPANRSSGLPDHVYRHIGLYAYRAGYVTAFTSLPACELEVSEALEQLRVLYNGDRIYVDVAVAEAGVGIDTSEDLEKVRAMVSEV